MTDSFVNRINDGLSVGPDFIDVLIEIEDPAEGLLRRGNVISFRTEYDNRRANVAQIDGRAVRGLDRARSELVADEQIVDDGLNFLGIQIDMSAPPALEAEIACSF